MHILGISIVGWLICIFFTAILNTAWLHVEDLGRPSHVFSSDLFFIGFGQIIQLIYLPILYFIFIKFNKQIIAYLQSIVLAAVLFGMIGFTVNHFAVQISYHPDEPGVMILMNSIVVAVIGGMLLAIMSKEE